MIPRYSVVVPVFESDSSVAELVDRICEVFANVVRASYEVILIDDGSRSASTWATLTELATSKVEVKAVRLTKNYGKPCAVLCGLNLAVGRWIITIDDDLEQRPEDLPKLIAFETHDVVVARFCDRRKDPLTKSTSWIKSRFDRLILKLPERMSPLKLIKADVVRAMLQVRTSRPFIPALLAHVTTDFISVDVQHEVSAHGKSRYDFGRRIRQFGDLLIGNSNLVLRCVGGFGAIVAACGMIYAVYVLARALIGTISEPGWATLVAINLVFGGLTLITLGIIGEYLIRILDGTTSRPPYVVREIVGDADRRLQETADC